MLLTSLLLASFVYFLVEWTVSPKLEPRTAKNLSSGLLLVSAAIVFVILAFNMDNYDWDEYQAKFDKMSSRTEPGFALLVRVVKFFHGDFRTILFLTGLLFVIVMLVRLRTMHNNLVIFFYGIYPLVLDINQTRNLIMYLLVILTLVFIENRRVVFYYLGLLIAATIHFSAVLYAPLYFLVHIKRTRFYQWMAALFALLSAGVLTLKLSLPYVLDHTSNRYIQYYAHYVGDFAWFYFAIQGLHQCIDLFTVFWIDRQLKDKPQIENANRLEVLYRTVVYSSLYLPLVAFFDEMYRLRRNTQLVKYMYVAYTFRYLNTRQRVYVLSLVLINLALTLLMFYYAGDFVLFKFFDANSLLGVTR